MTNDFIGQIGSLNFLSAAEATKKSLKHKPKETLNSNPALNLYRCFNCNRKFGWNCGAHIQNSHFCNFCTEKAVRKYYRI